MKTKKQQGNQAAVSLPLVIFLVLIAVAGYILWKQTTMQSSGAITSVDDLDKASQQLDQADIDGIGNELPQLENDSSSF